MKQIFSISNRIMITSTAGMLLLCVCFTAAAQVKVGNNPNTIKTASLMELESTDKGFVFPRVSLSGSLSSPAPLAADLLEGTVVYNNNSAFGSGVGLYIWTAGAWKVVTPGAGFTLPALTNGSVIFSNGTTLAQNNSNFFWDNANARLGIGTATPGYKLDVAGIGSFKASGASLLLSGTGAGSHTYAEFYPDGIANGRKAYLGYVNNGSTQLSMVNEIAAGDISMSTGRNLYLSAGTTGRFFMQGSSGNVGINSTNPQHALVVQAAAGKTELLGFYNNAGTDKYNFSFLNGGLNLSESNVSGGRLFIKDGGNVGINNVNPTQRLDVTGNIQISGSGNGLKFPDGTTQTTAAAAGTDNQTLTYTTATRVLNISGPANSNVTLPLANGTQAGLVSATDFTTFSNHFTLPALTNGSVIFSNGTTLTQNNTRFFWDNTNARLGIGTNAPSQKLEVTGSVYANGEGTGFLTDVGGIARVGLIKYTGHEGGIWRTNAQDFEIGRVDASVTSLPGTPESYTTDLFISGTGQVGVGTASTTATLDVNGSTRLRGLTVAGIVTTDANGNLTSSTAATVDATTAGNGLTKTATNITLGGTLSQATTINQGGNNLNIQGNGTSNLYQQIANPVGPHLTSYFTPFTSNGQSFTLSQPAVLTSITVYNCNTSASGSITLNLYSGNGSVATYSQSVTLVSGQVTYLLNTPQSLPAGTSRFEFIQGTGSNKIYLSMSGNDYPGGNSYKDGASNSFQYDIWFVLKLYISEASPTLFASSNGNVGIGTSSPQHKLQVYADGYGFSQTNGTVEVGTYTDNDYGWLGTASNHPLAFFTNNSYQQMVLTTGGFLGIGTNNPTYRLDVNGGIRCIGAVNITSDARLKQHIRPVSNALQGILKLNGVRYTFRDKEFTSMNFPKGEQIGVLAQEVEKVYPELVSTDDKGYKSVNYGQLNAVLIEAIKEQQQQVEAAKATASKLEKENASFKQDLETLKLQVKMLTDKITAAPSANQ